MRQLSCSTLVQVMAWRLLRAMPLPKQILQFWQLEYDHWEQSSWKSKLNYNIFVYKSSLKMSYAKWQLFGFVRASMCWWCVVIMVMRFLILMLFENIDILEVILIFLRFSFSRFPQCINAPQHDVCNCDDNFWYVLHIGVQAHVHCGLISEVTWELTLLKLHRHPMNM